MGCAVTSDIDTILTDPESEELEEMGPDVVKPGITSCVQDAVQQESCGNGKTRTCRAKVEIVPARRAAHTITNTLANTFRA